MSFIEISPPKTSLLPFVKTETITLHKFIKRIVFEDKNIFGKVQFDETKSILLQHVDWIYSEVSSMVVLEFILENVKEEQNFSFVVQFEKTKKVYTCCFTPLQDSKIPSVHYINSILDLNENKVKMLVMNNGSAKWNGGIFYDNKEMCKVPEIEPDQVSDIFFDAPNIDIQSVNFLKFYFVDGRKNNFLGDFEIICHEVAEKKVNRAPKDKLSFNLNKHFIEPNKSKREEYMYHYNLYKQKENELGLNENNWYTEFWKYQKNLSNLDSKALPKLEEILKHRKIVANLQTEPMIYYRMYFSNGKREFRRVSKEEDEDIQINHEYVIEKIEQKIKDLEKPKGILVK
eukprot:gene8913-861_t